MVLHSIGLNCPYHVLVNLFTKEKERKAGNDDEREDDDVVDRSLSKDHHDLL